MGYGGQKRAFHYFATTGLAEFPSTSIPVVISREPCTFPSHLDSFFIICAGEVFLLMREMGQTLLWDHIQPFPFDFSQIGLEWVYVTKCNQKTCTKQAQTQHVLVH